MADAARRRPRWLPALLAAALLAQLGACARQAPSARLEGGTMGTRYHITLVNPPRATGTRALQAAVERLLESVNDSMSTYREDSEIARVSRSPPDRDIALSPDFATVLAAALRVGELSGGAFDVTVGPLVELWGFGPERGERRVPDQASVERARRQVGYRALLLDRRASSLAKRAPRSLDFSALAKGYAVDRVAALLERRGIGDYLVEIGGDLRVAGHSPRGTAWALAIERPELLGGEPMARIALRDGAVATSGDYRNFFERDGKRYSHIIDPRSGYPVPRELVSVTVVAASAMLADAWATALLVLGPERALEVAEREALACYFVRRQAEGLRPYWSAAMADYLE